MPSMLRLLRSRPLALLAGLWFLVAGREPPFPHPCEMGGMGAVAAASSASEAAETATQSEHVHAAQPQFEHALQEHAHHGHAPVDATPVAVTADTHGDEHAPSTCECVDDCCVSVVVQAPAAITVVPAALLPRAPRQLAAVAARTTDASPRLLPFANGPPALS
jgi:hypothetical protein